MGNELSSWTENLKIAFLYTPERMTIIPFQRNELDFVGSMYKDPVLNSEEINFLKVN